VKGIWQCFACGAKGNLIEFTGEKEGLNPDDPQDSRKAVIVNGRLDFELKSLDYDHPSVPRYGLQETRGPDPAMANFYHL
jgi:hypothetical protein